MFSKQEQESYTLDKNYNYYPYPELIDIYSKVAPRKVIRKGSNLPGRSTIELLIILCAKEDMTTYEALKIMRPLIDTTFQESFKHPTFITKHCNSHNFSIKKQVIPIRRTRETHAFVNQINFNSGNFEEKTLYFIMLCYAFPIMEDKFSINTSAYDELNDFLLYTYGFTADLVFELTQFYKSKIVDFAKDFNYNNRFLAKTEGLSGENGVSPVISDPNARALSPCLDEYDNIEDLSNYDPNNDCFFVNKDIVDMSIQDIGNHMHKEIGKKRRLSSFFPTVALSEDPVSVLPCLDANDNIEDLSKYDPNNDCFFTNNYNVVTPVQENRDIDKDSREKQCSSSFFSISKIPHVCSFEVDENLNILDCDGLIGSNVFKS